MGKGNVGSNLSFKNSKTSVIETHGKSLKANF